MTPRQVLLVILATALMSISIFSAARKQLFPEAHAESAGDMELHRSDQLFAEDYQRRQAVALEKIASEMSRMRREKCR